MAFQFHRTIPESENAYVNAKVSNNINHALNRDQRAWLTYGSTA